MAKFNVPLRLSDRAMLIARIQAYTYSNVTNGNYHLAQEAANYAVDRFIDMMHHNPTDSAGYWANYYFDLFKQDMERLKCMYGTLLTLGRVSALSQIL